MKKINNIGAYLIVFIMTLFVLIPAVSAQERVQANWAELEKFKALYDDPRPFLKEGAFAYKNSLPPKLYNSLVYDVDKMQKAWADLVGFRAPDVVGKIAPEIKPDTYNYKDKEKFPGLKELMIPEIYIRFNAAGPPFAGNFSEIKVVPTRQYYFSLPVAEGTKKYEGQSKLDKEGYLIGESYKGGYPFPRPSGEFKAQQICYNWEKRYTIFESFVNATANYGYSKNLRRDRDQVLAWLGVRLQGRLRMEPYGWFDERAQTRGEYTASILSWVAPRDSYGNAYSRTNFLDRDTFDYNLIYSAAIRRIRTMSATDTQDTVGGGDAIYEDSEGFSQKLTPKRFPFKFKVIAEREYLMPTHSLDGSPYVTSASKGLEQRNLEFERRPMYVVELIQTDKNYVYGKRILYIDQETFILKFGEHYDQKGRLYRTIWSNYASIPEMGVHIPQITTFRDHIDIHSTVSGYFYIPAPWLTRDDINLQSAITKGK